MELENTMLSEVSQAQKAKNRMSSGPLTTPHVRCFWAEPVSLVIATHIGSSLPDLFTVS
jgi:hypothetical protein